MSDSAVSRPSGDEEKPPVNSEPQNPVIIVPDDSVTDVTSDPEKNAGSEIKRTTTSDSQHEYIGGIKLFLVMASVTLVCFLMLLDTSIITTAIPRITSDFNSLPDVGWYGSSYLLASAAIQPLTGKIYSQFSSKLTFMTFIATFELGSVICGAARSSIMLIMGRTIAGMGAAGLINGALTIISSVVPMHKRPAMTGIMMGCGQMGLVAGPLIGGALTQYASWRWCFYINLPVGGVAIILLILINIPDRVDKSDSRPSLKKILGQLDLIGFVLFAPFAVMLLLALQWGGFTYPWNSATIIGLFVGSAGTLFVFAAWEYHVGKGAMIPFFMASKGVSPALSGVYILPSILSMMVFAVASGIIVGKMGYYLPWIVVSGAVQLIGNGLLSTLKVDTRSSKWIGYQAIAGFGRGMGMQMSIIAVQTCLKPADIPVGMSILVFSQTIGGAVFLAVAQLIFSHTLLSSLRELAPGVNPETIINAGATAIRSVTNAQDLPGVLQSYTRGVDRVFLLGTGAAGAVFLFAWGMGWKSVKKAKAESKPVEPSQSDEVVPSEAVVTPETAKEPVLV